MEQNKNESNKTLSEAPPIIPPNSQQRWFPLKKEEAQIHHKQKTNKMLEIYLGWSEPF